MVDPPAGFIQNANSTPFTASFEAPDPADFPEWMGVESHETNRSLRAFELLRSDEAISFEEFIAYKFDVGYAVGSDPVVLRDRLVEIYETATPEQERALEVAREWTPDALGDNRGTALIVRTLAELIAAGSDVRAPRLVGGEFTDPELVQAFSKSVGDLVEEHGRVDPLWSEVNRLVRGDLDIPIGGGPDTLHAVYGNWTSGRFTGIAGDSYVLLVRWLPDGSFESRSIHQFGSATLDEDSAHYDDQAGMFAERRLKPVWFEEQDIRANLESEYRPGG